MKSFKQYFFEAINKPKIIMVGGPGSGKSTYSEIITKKLNIPHIYTGDMLRQLAKTNTPDGKKVKALLDDGKFAPIDITFRVVKERLAKPDARDGYLFDGFPRNVEQAERMVEENIDHDYVINLQVSEEEIIKRLTKRGREDDKPEIIKKRLEVYHRETKPLLDYYKSDIINIEAEGGTPEEIANKIIEKLK